MNFSIFFTINLSRKHRIIRKCHEAICTALSKLLPFPYVCLALQIQTHDTIIFPYLKYLLHNYVPGMTLCSSHGTVENTRGETQ